MFESGFIPRDMIAKEDIIFSTSTDKQAKFGLTKNIDGQDDIVIEPLKYKQSKYPDITWFIFKEHSLFSNLWFSIDIFFCIFSSYIYAFLAAFKMNEVSEDMNRLIYVIEIVFVCSLLKNFLTEYRADGVAKPVRDYKKIATRYLSNGFILDFLMIVPFAQFFISLTEYSRLFLLIKTYRLVKGLKIFNVSIIIQRIQAQQMDNIKSKIAKNPELGMEQNIDLNSIEKILTLRYFLQTAKLVIILLNISFFVGILFLIVT